MTTATFAGAYDPGPQDDDKPGLTDKTASYCSVVLAKMIAFVVLLAFVLAAGCRVAKPPTDVGRCPKCGRSYWDCACPTDE